jgi:hypothetical protein
MRARDIWLLFLTVIALVLTAGVASAATWTDWRAGDTLASVVVDSVYPGRPAYWSFDNGTTDSPCIKRHPQCPHITIRRRGGSSPIVVPYICEEDCTKGECEIAEDGSGDVTINDTNWGAQNYHWQFLLIDPTSGSGFIIAECGG